MKRECFVIRGGEPLFGKVTLHGAKNAVLPMLAAAVMTPEPVTVCDCPDITDVTDMLCVLGALGVKAERVGRKITVSGSPTLTEIPPELACAMRSSVFMLGALIAECGEVRLFTPGGCRIGARPLDIHFDGFSRLGVGVEYGEDYVLCTAKKLRGADIVMKYPSVGATENLLMAAVRAEGVTRLIGAAREPEITSLVRLLRRMGAQITGEGTPVLTVRGVDSLDGAEITPISDRIVAGTVMAGVAVCGGRVELENAVSSTLGAVISPFLGSHTFLVEHGGVLIFESDGMLRPTDVSTGPYPLFPTDMQAPFMACQCYASGMSSMRETVFEDRFAHVAEFVKMGARIALAGNTAFIDGSEGMFGAKLSASDLRGGAGLVVAALGAKGESTVTGLRYIDRGYEKLEHIFSSLGGKITRAYDDERS